VASPLTHRHSLLQIGRWGFYQLYHRWAWTYDAVAAVGSLGRWYDWVSTVIPFVLGPRILEIGPGTGHLLETLSTEKGLRTVGIDESKQMLRVAQARTGNQTPLVRALAQALPADAESFDTIVSTFPASFIRDARAIREYDRALRPGGRLVILPAAELDGNTLPAKLMAWALVFAGEAPRDSRGAISRSLLAPLERAGFRVLLHELKVGASKVFVIVATKAVSPA
jgi:SAM-dependent methyltransferase